MASFTWELAGIMPAPLNAGSLLPDDPVASVAIHLCRREARTGVAV